ncbi:beta-glucoside-specific PTS transporter subunit IIABC [[Clostridium] innocuum]|nr:beta-glucoside-specific PTS transporter subunit IIABC [Erysipelotrichaceae bacterium]MCR0413525.1 beta-glucoside-specific PTS transporter subunit IIABC [[Clostridium] innocuum]MCR0532781.1 beta-glucoside-specific PTS transporter subunit IIABC [[Clostridium] innocuum]MCR0536841.1 beta-glucoside-specific PTS transporter subunit IIABC [[Clostridium] innocuum]MDU1120312.1 beta-glucoside-specific PTS transporter subunit IIABC [Erysipelotrichaceae bacterium]
MKYEELCKKLIELVGGKNNIESVTHCSTRLRFNLKDNNLAKGDEIRKLKDVIEVVVNPIAYQIIIGPDVPRVHQELTDMLGGQTNTKMKKKNPVKLVLDLLSATMNPILKPIMTAGMIAGALAILDLLNILPSDSGTYVILDSIRSAVFYFLPVFLAMASAKKLNVNQYMAVALAVILLSTSINGVEGLTLFGIKLQTITYANSFIPILLGVGVMAFVDKLLDKAVPKSFEYFIKPSISLIVALITTLLFFGPIGMIMSNGLSDLCNWLLETVGNWTVIALYSALQPIFVTFGANSFSIPISLNYLSSLGYDPAILVACTIANIATSGAMFGYFFKAKNTNDRQLFATAGISAAMGITEPAIFGSFIKHRKPFYAVLIAGSISGVLAGILHVHAYEMIASVPGLVTFIGDGNHMNFYFMLLVSVVAFLIAFAVCYAMGYTSEQEEAGILMKDKYNSVKIMAPVKGVAAPLSEVEDAAFSTGALGKGIAIRPIDNRIVSPVHGQVVSLFPTKHAVGIHTDDNIDILIHIGINTVQLDGKYFNLKVKQGDFVQVGEVLVEADFEAMKKEGFDTSVLMVITNSNDFLEIAAVDSKEVNEKDAVLTLEY